MIFGSEGSYMLLWLWIWGWHSDSPCVVEFQAPNNRFLTLWTLLVGSVDRYDPIVQIVITVMGEISHLFLFIELSSQVDGIARLVEGNKKLFLF
jgi:hypothetical protein